ncbi:hypothetical protein [Solemya velesiana gill symbiont]|uniref:Uncharacterized protein n=1 Tax=Solemya velesiana gill symbiont TaxID=1918948 RepID=A0A1T2KW72_9GAMM|nr:hypothetical protein [Solemya velesiana gill symbiont]OOZ37093.1 hypothetical protein BOW51_04085 [Solemya velesiana gill symbiont]
MDLSTEDRIELYRKEIERHTPPMSHHDIFMNDVFQFLLKSALEQKAFEDGSGGTTVQETG